MRKKEDLTQSPVPVIQLQDSPNESVNRSQNQSNVVGSVKKKRKIFGKPKTNIKRPELKIQRVEIEEELENTPQSYIDADSSSVQLDTYRRLRDKVHSFGNNNHDTLQLSKDSFNHNGPEETTGVLRKQHHIDTTPRFNPQQNENLGMDLNTKTEIKIMNMSISEKSIENNGQYEEEKEESDIYELMHLKKKPSFNRKLHEKKSMEVAPIDNSFFSYMKDQQSRGRLESVSEEEENVVKTPPRPQVLAYASIQRVTTPALGSVPERAPTPTVNRPGFRGRDENNPIRQIRSHTPAPVFDGQWQSRNTALNILGGQNRVLNQQNQGLEAGQNTREIQNSDKFDEVKSVKAYKGLVHGLIVALLAFFLLFILVKEEQSWFYGLIFLLVPELMDLADELKMSVKKRNQIGAVQVSTNEQQNDDLTSLNQPLRTQKVFKYSRITSKLVGLILYIIFHAGKSYELLYLSLIPFVIISGISFLYDTYFLPRKIYLSLHIQVFKLIRLLSYVSLLVIIKQNNHPASSNLQIQRFWPVYIFYLIILPLSLILTLYIIYSRVKSYMDKNHRENAKKYIQGTVYMLLTLYSVIAVVLNLVTAWNNDEIFEQNQRLRRVLLGSGIFYTVWLAITIMIKENIILIFQEKLATKNFKKPIPIKIVQNESMNGQQSFNSNNNQVDIMDLPRTTMTNIRRPLISILNQRSLGAPGEPSQFSDVDAVSQPMSQSVQNNNKSKSEFSFNYVEQQNSVMYLNLKKEDINNLNYLDNSLYKSKKSQKSQISQKSKSRLPPISLKQVSANNDSILGNSIDLSRFNKFGLSPIQEHSKTLALANQSVDVGQYMSKKKQFPADGTIVKFSQFNLHSQQNLEKKVIFDIPQGKFDKMYTPQLNNRKQFQTRKQNLDGIKDELDLSQSGEGERIVVAKPFQSLNDVDESSRNRNLSPPKSIEQYEKGQDCQSNKSLQEDGFFFKRQETTQRHQEKKNTENIGVNLYKIASIDDSVPQSKI